MKIANVADLEQSPVKDSIDYRPVTVTYPGEPEVGARRLGRRHNMEEKLAPASPL